MTNLFTALESAENALEIYTNRKDDVGGETGNVYGQALQEFQIGFLYERHGNTFNSPLSKEYCRASDDFFAKKKLTKDL